MHLLISFLSLLGKEASIKLNSTKSEDVRRPHTATRWLGFGSLCGAIFYIHMQMTIAFLISAHNIRTHTRAAAAGWVLVGLSHTMSSLRQTTKPKNKRIDNGRAYLCRYKRKHPASGQRLQEEEIMERCCVALDLAPYNNNHNDKSTCSWTIHLLSACLWFLCTQSSLNLHGSYFMDSLHIITQCMEARRAAARELVFPFQQSELFYLLLPALASSRLMRLQPRTLQQRRNIFQIWRAKETEKMLCPAGSLFFCSNFNWPPIVSSLSLTLSLLPAAGHIIGHCVRRRCIVVCGSVSTCRKNATFPWHRHRYAASSEGCLTGNGTLVECHARVFFHWPFKFLYII